MEFVKVKTVLSKVQYGNEWYGIDYNMNLYRGCLHSCIYCDSRSNCYRIDNFDIVKGKEHVLSILEKELVHKKKRGVVGIGSMSDTYNPMEMKYKMTRGALVLLNKYGYGVSIDTKSDLILRDIDILKKIQKKNNVIVKFTITTPHDLLSKKIEPNVCVSSRRLEVVRLLSKEGIFVGIMMNPVLPFITDKEEDIKLLVKLAYLNGAKFIPNLKLKYIKKYGNMYQCFVPNYKELYQVFIEECEKYGILYRMEDIIKAYQKEIKTNEQISLFD